MGVSRKSILTVVLILLFHGFSTCDGEDSAQKKSNGLKQLENYLKKSFITTAEAGEIAMGVKTFQDVYNFTDAEIIDKFYFARLRIFHWDESIEHIIAQLMFILDKYIAFVEQFCSNEAAYNLSIKAIEKFPHLLHPSLGQAVHRFTSRLTRSCNKHFPAFLTYQKFLRKLFYSYADAYVLDLKTRHLYKEIFESVVKQKRSEDEEPGYDVLLNGFFKGILGEPLDVNGSDSDSPIFHQTKVTEL